jgi:hypothetical protein
MTLYIDEKFFIRVKLKILLLFDIFVYIYKSKLHLRILMPHLKSMQGLKMVSKYVNNWYAVIAFYLHLIQSLEVRFLDGTKVRLTRTNFGQFYERIYMLYLMDKGFKYRPEDGSELVELPNGLRFFLYTRKPYSFVFDEIFVMGVYSKFDVRDKVVIDVGASIADSSIYFATHGAKKVYSFEPDRERYHLGTKNIVLNKLEDTITLENRSATARRVSDVILQNNLSNIIMKIDCEGCEYELIAQIDKEIFKSISSLVMEYHSNPTPLVSTLQNLGFNVQLKKRELLIYATR